MTIEEFDIVKVGDRIYTESNKYVVVYRNKTRLYLKSSGTDILNFIQRDYSTLGNYDLIPNGVDDTERIHSHQKRTLRLDFEDSKIKYHNLVTAIAQIKATIVRNQKDLTTCESELDMYRTKYGEAKRKYEDFCQAHGFMADGVSGNDA